MRYGERLKDIVEAAVARGDAPGVVAAVARGDDTYVTAAGVQTVGGPPMGPDTLFRISSVTKPITAAGVLGPAEGGPLHLNGAVDALLPRPASPRVAAPPGAPPDATHAA